MRGACKGERIRENTLLINTVPTILATSCRLLAKAKESQFFILIQNSPSSALYYSFFIDEHNL